MPRRSLSSLLPTKVWLAVIGVYWCVLFALMHLPLNTGGVAEGIPVDKLFHLGAYGLFSMLLALTLDARSTSADGRPSAVTWPRAVAVFCGLLAYGGLDELTQPWTGRTCDPFDLLANVVGILGGLLALAVAERLLARELPTVAEEAA
jgi:hypothetical protein